MAAGIVSIHLADVGVRAAHAARRRDPSRRAVPGLRQAHVVRAATLTGRVAMPTLGRVGLVAFWDDDAALDRFLRADPLADILAGGFCVRLRPLRASGTWPGLSAEVPTARVVDSTGPVAALTLGRLRLSQAVHFLRASAKAEASMLRADGLIWATGLASPPLVSTFSLWRDAAFLQCYAYGQTDRGHLDAMATSAAKRFHHESAFIRFAPYASAGELAGKNPLASNWRNASLMNAAE